MNFFGRWSAVTFVIAFFVAGACLDDGSIGAAFVLFFVIFAASAALYLLVRFWTVVLILLLIAAMAALILRLRRRRKANADAFRAALDRWLLPAGASRQADAGPGKAVSSRSISEMTAILDSKSARPFPKLSRRRALGIFRGEYRVWLERAIVPVAADGRLADANRLADIIRYLDGHAGSGGRREKSGQSAPLLRLDRLSRFAADRPPILSGRYGAADQEYPRLLLQEKRTLALSGWSLDGRAPLQDVLWGTLLRRPLEPYTCAALIGSLWQIRADVPGRSGARPVCPQVLAAAIYLRGQGGGQALDALVPDFSRQLQSACRTYPADWLGWLASTACLAGSGEDEKQILRALRERGVLPRRPGGRPAAPRAV